MRILNWIYSKHQKQNLQTPKSHFYNSINQIKSHNLWKPLLLTKLVFGLNKLVSHSQGLTKSHTVLFTIPLLIYGVNEKISRNHVLRPFPLSCVQTTRKRMRKRKLSLMFATYSLIFSVRIVIFSAFAFAFAWYERLLHKQSYSATKEGRKEKVSGRFDILCCKELKEKYDWAKSTSDSSREVFNYFLHIRRQYCHAFSLKP